MRCLQFVPQYYGFGNAVPARSGEYRRAEEALAPLEAYLSELRGTRVEYTARGAATSDVFRNGREERQAGLRAREADRGVAAKRVASTWTLCAGLALPRLPCE